MEIEIFESQQSAADLQEKINAWTKEVNPEIISVNVSVTPMYDMYYGRAPEICNQWQSYTAAIVYKLK